MGCWAHARRNVFDARLYQPREVSYAQGLIAQWYHIEDTIRLKSAAGRLAHRPLMRNAHLSQESLKKRGLAPSLLYVHGVRRYSRPVSCTDRGVS